MSVYVDAPFEREPPCAINADLFERVEGCNAFPFAFDAEGFPTDIPPPERVRGICPRCGRPVVSNFYY